MRRSGFVILGVALLSATAFLVDGVLNPEHDSTRETSRDEPGYFPAPQWIAAGSDGAQIRLRWRPVPGALAYTLWRSPNPGGEFGFIHMGRDTTYADRDGLVPGNVYCYLLSATDPEFDESGLSGEKCVEFSGSGDDAGNKFVFAVK